MNNIKNLTTTQFLNELELRNKTHEKLELDDLAVCCWECKYLDDEPDCYGNPKFCYNEVYTEELVCRCSKFQFKNRRMF